MSILLKSTTLIVLLTLFSTKTKTESCENLVTDILEPYEAIGDSYYIIDSSTKVNWFKAVQLCQRFGANLASLETLDEMRALSDNLYDKGYRNATWYGDRYWLSGNDLSKKSEFTWLSTGKIIPQNNLWSDGEPSNTDGHEDCVELWLEGVSYNMNDVSCYEKMGYICEITEAKLRKYKLIDFVNNILSLRTECSA